MCWKQCIDVESLLIGIPSLGCQGLHCLDAVCPVGRDYENGQNRAAPSRDGSRGNRAEPVRDCRGHQARVHHRRRVDRDTGAGGLRTSVRARRRF